jgi:DNA mismatch repair protein MutH
VSRKGVLIFANAPYDPDDRESAIAHARRLVGKSLREAIDEFVPVTSKEVVMEEASKYATGNSKGKFGNAIEAGHFYYRPNSDKAPDLGWAELKCTGLKKLKKTLAKRAKERLVIGMINFGGGQRGEVPSLLDETFATSHAKRKLESLLLVFYDYKKDVPVFDLTVDRVGHWSPDANELRMIEEDWNTIRALVEEGKAHTISEGMTNLLGACTKGASGSSLVSQANSTERAKPRAFALKQAFVSQIYESLKEPTKRARPELSLVGMELYRQEKGRFEDFVVSRLNYYAGKSTTQICEELGIIGSFNGKGQHAQRMRRFLNAVLTGNPEHNAKNLAEFKKTGLTIKTLRKMKSGLPKEAASFPYFDYDELIAEEGEDWEDSEVYGMLTNRFLFIVLKFAGKGADPIFVKAIFHSLSELDLDDARSAWDMAIQRAKERRYTEMPGQFDNRVIHVRPHDSIDKKTGKYRDGHIRQCFWLNKSYLRDIIK